MSTGKLEARPTERRFSTELDLSQPFTYLSLSMITNISPGFLKFLVVTLEMSLCMCTGEQLRSRSIHKCSHLSYLRHTLLKSMPTALSLALDAAISLSGTQLTVLP